MVNTNEELGPALDDEVESKTVYRNVELRGAPRRTAASDTIELNNPIRRTARDDDSATASMVKSVYLREQPDRRTAVDDKVSNSDTIELNSESRRTTSDG